MKRSLTIVASAMLLAGCSAGDRAGGLDEATFFADPAKFAMYDCEQLKGVRAGYTARVAELKELMLKAETGPAGALVAEAAYRPDYVLVSGWLKSINQHWERNGCDRPAEAAADRRATGAKRSDPGRGGVN